MLDWLHEIRGNRSTYDVAEAIGIAQSTYFSIEHGVRRPSVPMAKRIAAALGFEWTRFFEDAPGTPPEPSKAGPVGRGRAKSAPEPDTPWRGRQSDFSEDEKGA